MSSDRPMCIALSVALAENGVIGIQGRLPWHLPADLRRFKQITMGHHLIMGRKTFESIGRLLPGRTTIIVTRQVDYRVPGARVCHDLPAAYRLASADEIAFIVGGATLYEQALPVADRLYVTRVHACPQGDTVFPKVDWRLWRLVEQESVPADARNPFDLTFEVYERLAPQAAGMD